MKSASSGLKSMPPKLVSDDGAHVVIRPLLYAAEESLARFAVENWLQARLAQHRQAGGTPAATLAEARSTP